MAHILHQSVSYRVAAHQSSRAAVNCGNSVIVIPAEFVLACLKQGAGIQPYQTAIYNRLNLLRISATIILSVFFIPLKVSISLPQIRGASSKAKAGHEVRKHQKIINQSIVTIYFKDKSNDI